MISLRDRDGDVWVPDSNGRYDCHPRLPGMRGWTRKQVEDEFGPVIEIQEPEVSEMTESTPDPWGEPPTRERDPELEALAIRLFEQQYIRNGGRKPDDPVWGEILSWEQDYYIEAARDAKPLLDELRTEIDRLANILEYSTTPVGARKAMYRAVNLQDPISDEDDNTPYEQLRTNRAMEVVYGWFGTLRAAAQNDVAKARAWHTQAVVDGKPIRGDT